MFRSKTIENFIQASRWKIFSRQNQQNQWLVWDSVKKHVFITNLLRAACWKKYGASKSFNNTHLETKW